MNLERLILRLHVLLVVSLVVPQPSKAGYAEEAIQVKPAGFTISQVTHDFSAGQIIVDAEISADPSMVTLLYLPRPNASAAFADSFDVKKHPCELSKNDPCCLNALVSDYQVAPEMAGLFQHNDLCPASGVPAVVGSSLANPALGAVLYPTGIAGAGFLSSGGAPGSYTYDDRVSYSATPVGTDKYTIQLRFPHAYIADRAIVSAVGGGIKRYEFFVGASFVKLLSYSSLIDVKTIQTNVHYNKADYLFTSVSSEQNRLAFDGINVFLHQGRSQTTNKLYQYLELHLDWNETRYPAASAAVVHDSLALAKSTAHSAAASWLEPCTASTGYYYTAAEKANLDALALETCLPSQPAWCAFAGTRFFAPLPPDTATDSQGWITAADAANQLFVDFVLRLATPQGDSVFSNVYLSIDLASLVPLAHCDENKFLFVSVADIVKIQAHVGVQHANDSYTTLNQTSTENSLAYEIAENQNVMAPGRRLLEAAATQPIAWYKMDDPAAVGRDSISGNDASVSNVIVDSTSALPAVAEGCEAAVRFTTAAQDFDLPSFTITTSEMTVSLWFRPVLTQVDYASVFDFKDVDPGTQARFLMYGTGYPDQTHTYTKTWMFGVKKGSDWEAIPVVIDVNHPTEWVHIGFRIRSSGEWSITANGVERYNQITTIGSLPSATYTVNRIGNHRNELHRLDAHMRDFRLYDQALSDAEFGALHTSTLEFCAPAAAPAATHDFSCDAALVMRYAFDDPLNPGVDSVSGNSAGITGDVTVADGYASFNGGYVRLEPWTISNDHDITFTFWINPSISANSLVFYIGSSNVGIFKANLLEPNVLRLELYNPAVGWGSQDVSVVRDGVSWSFITWKIRASDGLWVILVNEEEVFNGIKVYPKASTHDGTWHDIGSSSYSGKVDDFRIYHAFLSTEEVVATRAGGPASTCAAPVDFSCDAGILMRFSGTDATQPGLNSVTGLDTSYGNVAVVDGALSFTGGGITLPSFEVFEGDSLTISFWMKPIAQATTENIFRLGTLHSEQSPIHFYRSKNGPLWYLISQTEGGTYRTLTIPQDGNTWTFISWRIRADGFWSVQMDDVVAFEGQELRIKPQVYDGAYHEIGGGTNYYYGGLRDFRIYRSYLSAEQVEAIRAGGPATACAASSCTPVALTAKAQAMRALIQQKAPLIYNDFADFDGSTVPDRMGNGFDVSLTAGSANVVDTTVDGSAYASKVLQGSSSTKMLWPANSLPARFTLCASWFNGGGVGFGAALSPTQYWNVLFGGLPNENGVFRLSAFSSGNDVVYLSSRSNAALPADSWMVFCINTVADSSANLFLDAQRPPLYESGPNYASPQNALVAGQLTVNYASLLSNFKMHSVLVWDSELSASEMQVATAALREELGGVPYGQSTAVSGPGAGFSSDFWEGPTECESAPGPPAQKKKKQKVQKVKATMSLPLTVEQFNEDVQLEYRTTIAAVAGVAVAQVQILSIKASGGGSRRLLQSGGVDVETEIEDDGSGSLEAVGEVLTEEAVNTYIQESGSTTLPTLTMSELTTEVVFFDIPTLGNFSGALSYSDAAIGISFDMTEFIQEASWAAGMRYRVDDAILFNFLNLGANASSFYPALRDAVRNKTLFSIERAEGSGVHHLQMNLPPEVLCDEVTTQGANTILSAANLDCFYRRAIVDDVVQPAASESVFFYRKNNDEEAARDFIERNMLGSDSEWANETASAYFYRVCPGSLDASATTNTYGCIFADPGYRWLSRHAFSGLDSFLLSDKTILVLLVSVLDASGNVFRRRLLSQDDLEGGIFADHGYKSRRNDGQRSLLQLRDDQTEQVLSRLKSESADSSVAFETSQESGAAKAAVMKGLGGSRWQLIEMQGLKETWVSPNTYMRNLKVMLQHVTSFFTKSLRGIEIVSARVRKNGAGGGTSVAGRRLLSTGDSSSEGETDTVDVLGLLRISDFTGAPVYEQEISCVFSELASTGRNLTFQEQFELLLNCQMMREGVFSYPANLTLRECGMGAATLDSRDCLAISLRREMALPSLAASNGNSGDGVSAAWVVVSIVLLSVVGIGILVQGTRQKIVVVTHQADPFLIIDEKIPLHPMHQPVLSLREQNI